MTQLIIDTSDKPEILRASRNMLNELLGESQTIAIATGLLRADKKPADDSGGQVANTGADDGGSAAGTSRGKAAGPGSAKTETRVDPNKVVFNPEFCGNAAKPFYSSGKRKDQWKKRQGVDDVAYDAWYAEQIALVAAAHPGEDAGALDTSGAFGGDGGSEPANDPAPEDCGAFMGWVSAKQAAGLLTPDDIGEAYATADIQVTALFPPNDDATVKQHVTALYNILVVKAGA